MIIKQSSTENTATVRSGKSDAINNDVINNDAINKLHRYNYATQPVHNNALSATPRKTTLLGVHPLASASALAPSGGRCSLTIDAFAFS